MVGQCNQFDSHKQTRNFCIIVPIVIAAVCFFFSFFLFLHGQLIAAIVSNIVEPEMYRHIQGRKKFCFTFNNFAAFQFFCVAPQSSYTNLLNCPYFSSFLSSTVHQARAVKELLEFLFFFLFAYIRSSKCISLFAVFAINI